MPNRFESSTVTLAAATAQRLSDLLVAEGYTGSLVGKFYEIDPQTLADVYRGADATVNATNGRPMTVPYSRTATSPQLPADVAGVFLYSTLGGDIGVTFEAYG